MHNYDDVNFECRFCGTLYYHYRNVKRIAHLILPQSLGGMGMPTCNVCGHVSVGNNGGFSCLECSAYYELPTKQRPDRTLHLMPRTKDVLPRFMSFAMILLAGNLVVIMAVVFGG
jgi:hypothetical protein